MRKVFSLWLDILMIMLSFVSVGLSSFSMVYAMNSEFCSMIFIIKLKLISWYLSMYFILKIMLWISWLLFVVFSATNIMIFVCCVYGFFIFMVMIFFEDDMDGLVL